MFFKRFLFLFLFVFLSSYSSFSLEFSDHPKVKVLVSTYYAHKWSHQGRYKVVSKNGKRLGDYVALNFLPGGSIVMIPRLFGNTTFEVADTFGGSGIGYFRHKKYWKIDILRNKGEWYDDVDSPVDLYVVKFNSVGPVKNSIVRRNTKNYLKLQ